jgi:hypothetical protein
MLQMRPGCECCDRETIYYDEAHGWSSKENHVKFLRQLEQFLARSLAPR